MSEFLTVRELKSLARSGARPFASTLVLRRLSAKTAANGNPFLSADLGDRTGSLSCTVFSDSPVFECIKAAAEGSILRLEGRTESFQGRLSPRLTRVAVVPEAELSAADLDGLVEASPEDPGKLWAEFQDRIADIGQPELRATVQAAIEDIGEAFQTAPAAVAMHHAYRHGLIEHTVRMSRAARALLPLYPEVDADLALAGVLLHDIGKAIEYQGVLATKRGRAGILHGHVVLGYQIARKAALKSRLDPDRMERLEHIILSHQGQLEWGAAALAATPEAVFVSMVDYLDAKMGAVQHAVRTAPEGQEFSERLPSLESPVLTKPVPKS